MKQSHHGEQNKVEAIYNTALLQIEIEEWKPPL